MKCAIYTRVSTQDQDPGIQEEICRNYCKAQGWEIHRVYSDKWSGSAEKRPQFNNLLEDMRMFKFNTIVVTKIDRIGRSLQHLLSLFNEFKTKKIGFVATQQNIDTTTSMGMLQLQILGAFAEFERNLISERTRDALKGKKNVGKRGPDKKPRKKVGYYLRHMKKKPDFLGGV